MILSFVGLFIANNHSYNLLTFNNILLRIITFFCLHILLLFNNCAKPQRFHRPLYARRQHQRGLPKAAGNVCSWPTTERITVDYGQTVIADRRLGLHARNRFNLNPNNDYRHANSSPVIDNHTGWA